LAPRDITSRATAREIRAGRGIHPNGSAGGLCLSGSASHGSGKNYEPNSLCWEAHRLLGIDAVHQSQSGLQFTIAWVEYL